MRPWMDYKEIDLIKSYLTPTDIMLEWGSGGSTTTFSPLVSKYYSIEHVKDWYIKVDKELEKVQLGSKVTNILQEPDFPRTIPTKDWEFESYINYPSKFNTNFDKVLIDGRGRQYCATYILDYLNPGAKVFIHDFWQRPQYHYILEYYTEVASVKDTLQTLVILEKK